MPGEKEINVNLFERLDLLDRKLIERKLYQQPPLTKDE